ncbi:hypothetical protein CPC08DRAFT_713801 [Agrocybe pediades]|nr:hypothetical protein CPC08DRAFT_713801 [Agrocybe pediades]
MGLDPELPLVPATPYRVRRRDENTGKVDPILYYGYALTSLQCSQWEFKRRKYSNNIPGHGEVGRALCEMEFLFPKDEVYLGSAYSNTPEREYLYIWVVGSNRNMAELRRAHYMDKRNKVYMCEVLDLEFQEPQWYYRAPDP